MPRPAAVPASDRVPLPAVLLLERDPAEAQFLYSVLHDVLKMPIWLWHEDGLTHALAMLAIFRFRLILLDFTFAEPVSPRALIRRIQEAAVDTPIVLRGRPEDLTTALDPRLYGVAAVVPKGSGGPTVAAIRRLLPLP